MMSRIAAIKNFGQKIWLDNLSRELINSGTLQKLLETDKIAGITSNPTIFHKAISSDALYKRDLEQAKSSEDSLEARYESLVIPDIKQACDLLLPLYKKTNKEDGYVSFEVSPHLALDTRNTVNTAKRLWETIKRPNLMVKIPATKAGIEAFQQLTEAGINVNITLLFSLAQVLDTWQAYINGLNARHGKNQPVDHIKAVASFFLSRVDSAVDSKLPVELQGKTAINLSKTAYLAYQDIFNGEMFTHLKQAGAKPQYLLWASTGTKNPAYSDVLYIEELIGKETINTAPDATLNAFRDHGHARASLIENINDAPKILEKVKQFVNLQQVGETLQQDGLTSFENSFNSLLELVR